MRRLLLLLAGLFALAAPSVAHAYTFFEWDATAAPTSVAISGPAGVAPTVYYSMLNNKDIGRSTLGGTALSDRTNPSATSRPQQLAAGQAGDVWFADPADDALGHGAANGTFAAPADDAIGHVAANGTFATPVSTGANSDPVDLAVAQNGTVWAVENTGDE